MRDGATIGAYRVGRKLGEGGMGVVYVGEHTLLGRRAAIKVLLPELSANREVVQRFFNEAKAVTQIADPGIVQVFDFGYAENGSAFLVLELLDGESMDHRLVRIKRFSPIDCMRLMRQICTSLHAAHVKGVVHRDLKPENIFIVGDPAVTGGERTKILDFGIAKLSTEEPGMMKTRTGMFMGTPVYMSPEQCRGAGEVDYRSDIYSIGCVMMTMLTGSPPFDGAGSGDLIAAHLLQQAPNASSRMNGLPPIIDQILQRCLHKAPSARFGSMMELVDAIGHAEQQLYSTASTITGGAAAYASSGRTPPPGSLQFPTAPGTFGLSSPTTLTGAAGQVPPPVANRRGRFVAIAAVIATAATIAIIVGATRGGANEPRAASPDGAVKREALVMDAAPVVAPVDAAPLVIVTPTVDASVQAAPPDAMAAGSNVIDAGEPLPGKRPGLDKLKPPRGKEHGQKTGTGADSVDRGD
ncbi:hypothetical protein BH11MYX2_BH11MYX2_04050 [soil metagenome]